TSHSMVPTEQRTSKWSKTSAAPHSHIWSERICVGMQRYAARRCICTAEIRSNAKPIVEITGQGGVPTVRIRAAATAAEAAKPCVLVAAEDFRFGIALLRHRRQRK